METTQEQPQVPSNPSIPPEQVLRSTKSTRSRLFAALAKGEGLRRWPTTIHNADGLDTPQLQRCFEILHASGQATEPTMDKEVTCDAMEGFLGAVFASWKPGSEEFALPRPELEFVVQRFVVAGTLREARDHGPDDGVLPASFQKPIYAVTTFSSSSAVLEISFSTTDPAEGSLALFNPWDDVAVEWDTEENWFGDLMDSLEEACARKVCSHNKRLAIWYTRKEIWQWANFFSSQNDAGRFRFVKATQFLAMRDGIRASAVKRNVLSG